MALNSLSHRSENLKRWCPAARTAAPHMYPDGCWMKDGVSDIGVKWIVLRNARLYQLKILLIQRGPMLSLQRAWARARMSHASVIALLRATFLCTAARQDDALLFSYLPFCAMHDRFGARHA